MKQNDAFPSNFLKADDIEEGEELTLTITKVVKESMKNQAGEEEIKPVAQFAEKVNGTEKKLVLNKTNFGRIVTTTGQDDSDNWGGKQITLYTEIVDAFGESKPAIRVKAVSGKQAAIDAYWKYAKEDAFLSPEEGRTVLKENGGDFVAALASLKKEADEVIEKPKSSVAMPRDINAALAATDTGA